MPCILVEKLRVSVIWTGYYYFIVTFWYWASVNGNLPKEAILVTFLNYVLS